MLNKSVENLGRAIKLYLSKLFALVVLSLRLRLICWFVSLD